MSPLEIRELPLEVALTHFECAGLDKAALEEKLKAASFADLVAIVESLGF
jgi:exonuclease VII small subunit